MSASQLDTVNTASVSLLHTFVELANGAATYCMEMTWFVAHVCVHKTLIQS